MACAPVRALARAVAAASARAASLDLTTTRSALPKLSECPIVAEGHGPGHGRHGADAGQLSGPAHAADDLRVVGGGGNGFKGGQKFGVDGRVRLDLPAQDADMLGHGQAEVFPRRDPQVRFLDDQLKRDEIVVTGGAVGAERGTVDRGHAEAGAPQEAMSSSACSSGMGLPRK